ncbi:hypothetical protein Ancab_007020 [Ancistrocladus abbreviatus]
MKLVVHVSAWDFISINIIPFSHIFAQTEASLLQSTGTGLAMSMWLAPALDIEDATFGSIVGLPTQRAEQLLKSCSIVKDSVYGNLRFLQFHSLVRFPSTNHHINLTGSKIDLQAFLGVPGSHGLCHRCLIMRG